VQDICRAAFIKFKQGRSQFGVPVLTADIYTLILVSLWPNTFTWTWDESSQVKSVILVSWIETNIQEARSGVKSTRILLLRII